MTKRNQQKLKLLFSTAVLFILSIGGLKSNEESHGEVNLKIVRIGLPGISNSILEAGGIAISNKYFEQELAKEGYQTELVFFQQAGPALNEAFAANKIDIALYGDLPITVLKTKGTDVKVFAVDNARLQFGTIVQNESPAQTIGDLQGQKVIYGKGTVQQRYFKEITESYGLNPDKFEMVNAVGADANSIFSGKQADSMFTFYYTVLFMQSKKMGRVIDSTLDKPQISAQSLVVGRNVYLKQNERVPVAIIRALQRAKTFAAENPQAAFNIFAQNNIPAEVYAQAYSADLSFQNFDPQITRESVEKLSRLINFLADNRLVDKRIKVEELITTEYYEQYLQEK